MDRIAINSTGKGFTEHKKPHFPGSGHFAFQNVRLLVDVKLCVCHNMTSKYTKRSRPGFYSFTADCLRKYVFWVALGIFYRLGFRVYGP
jgi:hypothetical protein